MLQNVLFLLRFSCFYGIGISQIAAGLWLISRVLEKLILTAFASVLIAFMEEFQEVRTLPFSLMSPLLTVSSEA